MASNATALDPNLTRELLRSTVEASQKSLKASSELYRKSEARLVSHETASAEMFRAMEARMKSLEATVSALQLEVKQLKEEKRSQGRQDQAADKHPSASQAVDGCPTSSPALLGDQTEGRMPSQNADEAVERIVTDKAPTTISGHIVYTDDTLRTREEALQTRLTQVEEGEALIKAEDERLRAWQAELEKQATHNKERQAVLDDHEQEVEQRLKLVQQREADQYFKEGMLAMLARGKTHQEQVATNFRREQDTKAMKKEYKTRLEQLNKAEEQWCQKTGQPYVPIVI